LPPAVSIFLRPPHPTIVSTDFFHVLPPVLFVFSLQRLILNKPQLLGRITVGIHDTLVEFLEQEIFDGFCGAWIITTVNEIEIKKLDGRIRIKAPIGRWEKIL
jgi:hypothetical protein